MPVQTPFTRRFYLLTLTLSLFAALAVAGCDAVAPEAADSSPTQKAPAPSVQRAADSMVPLTDMQERTYLGFEGGLYPGGDVPGAHRAEGIRRALDVGPVDTAGNPDPNGAFVMLSVGMSNATQEFCNPRRDGECAPWTFVGQAQQQARLNRDGLVFVDGAGGGRVAETWDSPDDTNYDRVRDEDLAPRGLTEAQVQVVWLKVANRYPSVSLPSADADAYQLEASIGNIARALQVRYPNLKLVFISSRMYAGYAATRLSPEPYAYETGFAVKWAIEAQIEQMTSGTIDAESGDLAYGEAAPWIGWGPYLWANGGMRRSDGLTWGPSDFEADGTHPSMQGETKVGTSMLRFFAYSPFSQCWIATGGRCE